MSRGLGKVERQILHAFEASRYGSTSLQSLVYLVAGVITELGEDPPDRTIAMCSHQQTIEYEGGEYISESGHVYWPCPAPNGECFIDCRAPVGWINQTEVVRRPVHTSACFPAWVEPSPACQRAVSRAVQSLARKGLVRREITGFFVSRHPWRHTTVWRPDAWAVEEQQRATREKQQRSYLTRRLSGMHTATG
jgi:hypothetical protein